MWSLQRARHSDDLPSEKGSRVPVEGYGALLLCGHNLWRAAASCQEPGSLGVGQNVFCPFRVTRVSSLSSTRNQAAFQSPILLAVNNSWATESQVCLGITELRGYQSLSRWSHTHAQTGSSKWIWWTLNLKTKERHMKL